MLTFDQIAVVHSDELAILLAAVGALILEINDCVMRRKAGEPRDAADSHAGPSVGMKPNP